jgi:hypothetical protein
VPRGAVIVLPVDQLAEGCAYGKVRWNSFPDSLPDLRIGLAERAAGGLFDVDDGCATGERSLCLLDGSDTHQQASHGGNPVSS